MDVGETSSVARIGNDETGMQELDVSEIFDNNLCVRSPQQRRSNNTVKQLARLRNIVFNEDDLADDVRNKRK